MFDAHKMSIKSVYGAVLLSLIGVALVQDVRGDYIYRESVQRFFTLPSCYQFR